MMRFIRAFVAFIRGVPQMPQMPQMPQTYSNTGPTKRKTAYGRYLLRDDKRGWNGARSRL